VRCSRSSTFSDKEGAMETLLRALTPPASGEPDALPHLIDLPPTSRLYKTLLQGGHYDRTSQAISRIQPSIWDSTAFASKFVRQVGEKATVGMCTGQGNGAFVVAELAEALLRGSSNDITEGQWVKEAIDAKETLKGWFGEEVLRQIEHGDAKGKNVLLEKLSVL
jgi:pumilio family protein 6